MNIKSEDKYRVLTFGLTNSDYEELRDEVAPEAKFTTSFGGGGFTPHYDFFFNAHVLLPIAGAIGKSVLDVIVDRVKEWLKRRPEDRTIEVYGPDGTVVSVIKVGAHIETKSSSH
jgi:hypothetical protein